MTTIRQLLACRVLTGLGSRHDIPAEVERIDSRRVLLVSTPSAGAAADELAQALGIRLVARFDRPAVHTPVAVTVQAMQQVRQASADAVVAIGGGSAIGLAKAVSARSGMPQIAVPTTYAGSEVTGVLGETENGVKATRRDPALAPGTVVYDAELTVSMPAGLTRTSGLNALAHAVEALWAPDATALTDAMATEAFDLFLRHLPDVLADPADLAGRERLQSAGWLAGLCLAQTRMGLHHQLAHALGGTFDLPHAELHAMLLPHVMAFNLPFAPATAARLVRASGADPVAAVAEIARGYDGPTTLEALGVPREGLRDVAERVAAAPYPNPRTFDADELAELLDAVWR
ncbi:MAG TPA: maleylacetate reductase [Nakamurella sp.]